MEIVATGSVSVFFHDAVEDAMRVRRVEATEGATTYIVSLLTDYAKPDDRTEKALDRPLAFLLDEALHTAIPAERFDRLRALGDGVLYSCGFFGDHFEARGVDQSYLVRIGTTAYSSASAMLHVGPECKIDIYGELATKFGRFVDVLAEVSNATFGKGASGGAVGLLKVYERWLKTRSETLAQTLTSRGLVPLAGPKGVQ